MQSGKSSSAWKTQARHGSGPKTLRQNRGRQLDFLQLSAYFLVGVKKKSICPFKLFFLQLWATVIIS